MKKTIILSLLAAACLTACSSDDQAPQQEPRLLTVEVSENPLLDANGTPKQVKTRTEAATTIETLNILYMDCADNNGAPTFTFNKNNSGVWSPDVPTYTWPTNGSEEVSFYAYNYYEGETNYCQLNWNSGAPYFHFVVNSEPTIQHDLLVAKNMVAYNDYQGKVPLTFDHACVAVKFNIYAKEEVINKGKTVSIKSVELSGVKNEGQYHYDAETKWQSLSGSATYTLTDGVITLNNTEKHALPCGYLFLIPQTKEGLTLTVTYSVDNGVDKYYYFHLSDTSKPWVAGRKFTLTLPMDSNILQ